MNHECSTFSIIGHHSRFLLIEHPSQFDDVQKLQDRCDDVCFKKLQI